jgi:hypothetical protein
MESEENHKNGVPLDPAGGDAPLTLLGAMPPRPPVGSVISCAKCDQLMRPGVAASVVCQRWRDQRSKPFERGVTL